jgi:hypothetical protein
MPPNLNCINLINCKTCEKCKNNKTIKYFNEKNYNHLYKQKEEIIIKFLSFCWEKSTCTNILTESHLLNQFLTKIFNIFPYCIIAGGFPAYLYNYKKTYHDIDVFLFIDDKNKPKQTIFEDLYLTLELIRKYFNVDINSFRIQYTIPYINLFFEPASMIDIKIYGHKTIQIIPLINNSFF